MKRMIPILCLFALFMCFFASCGQTATEQSMSSDVSTGQTAAPTEQASDEPEVSEETPAAAEAQSQEVHAGDQESEQEPALESQEGPEEEETVYNVVEFPFTDVPTTLNWFLPAPNLPQNGGMEGYKDFETIQMLNQASNVEMQFTEVPFMAYSEQFNLVCASGDLPDLLYGVSNYFAAGLTAAKEQDIIISVNDYLETCAPDYLRLIDEKGLEKQVKNDNGDILQFSQLVDSLAQKSGGVIRSDWLNALGMEVPETVDQLEEALMAFKTEYGCAQPLYMTNENTGANIIFAYGLPSNGVSDCMYQVDGQVRAVYQESGLKDYLERLHKWYDADLFSHDYMAVSYDPFAQAEKVLLADNDVAVWSANLNDIPSYADVAEEGFLLEPLPSLVLNEGDELHCSSMTWLEMASVSISTGCEAPDLASKWINYWYSDEGYLQYNYGVEGVTFEREGHGARFTEMVDSNDLGLTASQFLRLYCLAGQIPGYQAQKRTAVYYDDMQNKAWDVWSESLGDDAYIIPSGISLTAEESNEYASIVSDILTYASENIPRFVVGDRSFEEWDSFVAEVEGMNLRRAIEIYQGALDRYNAR